ncbi:hypothetical protein Tco_1288518, partial [Tanacetum coccineum]
MVQNPKKPTTNDHDHDQARLIIHNLSSLLLTILRHPDDNMTSSSSPSSPSSCQKIISNGGLVWLMMGVSLALM